MDVVKRQIAVTKENREFLSRAFKVTSVMVWKALNYKCDTDLAKRIRKMAIIRGGHEFVSVPVELLGKTLGNGGIEDYVETFHDSDGFIRQYMANGAMIELSKNDGTGDVFFKGELVKRYDNVTLPMIESIQQYAMTLA